jgi:predicted AAA+ superfamily ATPase
MRQTFPRAHRIDLLDERVYHDHLGSPGLLAAELRALRRGDTVVVDEVQRIPSLLNEVHRQIEEHGLRFVLCGSSARKLRQGGTNLLAGRAVRRHLHPFVPEELGPAFDLDETLRWGSLPIVWSARDRRDTLEAYVQTYLREEIRAEALVRNLPGFVRFLPIAGLFHGQVLNAAALARDAQIARTTVLGYLEVLEDTLLAFRLPAFEGKLRVKERKHPKLYWCDPGVARAVLRRFDPPGEEERGPLLEGWVASLLRAYGDYRQAFEEWFYWGPGEAAQTEVDFLLRRGSEFLAIEVKASRTFRESDLRGLRAVAGLKGLRRRWLVHLGSRILRTEDGIDVLPVGEFLRRLEAGAFFGR